MFSPTLPRRLLALLLLALLPKPSSRPARLGTPDRLGAWLAASFPACSHD